MHKEAIQASMATSHLTVILNLRQLMDINAHREVSIRASDNDGPDFIIMVQLVELSQQLSTHLHESIHLSIFVCMLQDVGILHM
jgi:hypothetical protein